MTSDRHSIAPYPLRLPSELRSSLEESAKKEGRSLHAEILARLQAAAQPEREKLLALADALATRELELLLKDTEIEALRVSLSYAALHLQQQTDDPGIKELVDQWVDYDPPADFFTKRLDQANEKLAEAKLARLRLHNKSPVLNMLKHAGNVLRKPRKKDAPSQE